MIVAMTSSSDLVGRLRALPAAAPLLAALGEDARVHLVGGAVRDLLLGDAAPVDLDLVVEGDAIAVARRFAEQMETEAAPAAGVASGDAAGVELRFHERFGTATVRAAGHAYDFAGARAETYERPGALPDVRPGTLSEDLLRRDFTVNAVALALDGRLDAAPGALDDLDARVLRVLHDASFADDPTRLLRMVRYATRLGFAVESHTDALARAALAERCTCDRHAGAHRRRAAAAAARAKRARGARVGRRLGPRARAAARVRRCARAARCRRAAARRPR